MVAIAVIATILAPKEPKDNGQVPISNLDESTKNISPSRRIDILYVLHDIVAFNTNDSVNTRSITDAVIREGSDTQSSPQNGHYEGSFIVDIASIKQSYRITYRYSAQNDSFDKGYPIVASCLDASELKFGAFDCKDPNVDLVIPTDPLLKKLPYITPYYTINGQEADGKKTLIIQIMVNTNGARTMTLFNRYKEEAKAWLASQTSSLDGYTIEWRNLSNKIVPESTPPPPIYE
jgi:hypothetical protein